MVTEDSRSDWLRFLDRQLSLAYERNREVGAYQKGTMRMLFAFYALVLGALVLRGEDAASRLLGEVGPVAFLVPGLVLLVGLTFVVQHFGYELYTKIYKASMRDLENAICDILSGRDLDLDRYNVKYYGEREGSRLSLHLQFTFDPGFWSAVLVLVAMNHGVAFLVLSLLQVKPWYSLALCVASVVAHGLSIRAIWSWHVGRLRSQKDEGGHSTGLRSAGEEKLPQKDE